jgi:tetratricopeptide (TPR) repeat protein
MPTPAALSPIWNVPYRQNPFFTGGEEILSRLHRELQKEHAAALSQPQGISGLGGIGKTQVALEYAYRYHADYTAVLWVRADSASTLTSEFVAVAHVLGLPERDVQDQAVIVEAVLRWLRQQVGWLLVLDNVDDLAVVEPFMPKAGRGHLLLTTRARALGGLADRIEVQKMEPETGALFLLRRTSLIPLQSSLEIASDEERTVASKISQVLDGLPLALDQAGSYIKETPCDLQEYLELYQTRHQELLRSRGRFDEDYPGSVATTWSLSFEKVTQANPASAELLDFCAFLSPDAIPEEMITGGAPYLGPLLQPVAADPVLFDQSIAVLLAYSLLARHADDNVLSIHRLVQAVLRDALPAETEKQWMQRTVQAVHATYPEVHVNTWPLCQRYLPHAQVCATFIEQWQIVSTTAEALTAEALLHQAGLYLAQRSQYAQAELFFKQALNIFEKVMGPGYPDISIPLISLAAASRGQNKHAQAESLYKRALEICRNKPMPRSKQLSRIATILNGLAVLYVEQGKYAQAESHYVQALEICEQMIEQQELDMYYGSSLADSSDIEYKIVLNSYNLARLCHKRGKYAQAELLYRRALDFYEEEYGPEFHNTADTLSALGLLYVDQGKCTQAEPLLTRALEIHKKIHEPEDRRVAISMSNLAKLYYVQSKYEQAESLYTDSLAIHEMVSGLGHLDVAESLNDLAKVHYAQGKYTEVERLYQRALMIFEQVLGPEHPSVANSLDGLGMFYSAQSDYTQAEPLYQRALAIRKKILGPEHPDVATSLENYADLLRKTKRHAKAVKLEVRAKAIRAKMISQKGQN